MPFVLDTRQVSEPDRSDFVHEALGTTLVPIELHWPPARQAVAARGRISEVGDLTICSGTTTAWRVERTPRLARDSLEPCVFINLQHHGTSILVQNGRQTVAHPGELVMYDATSPYTLLNDTGVSGDFFRIPHSALALPHDLIREACAVNLSPGHALTSLTNDYLRRVAADPALHTAPNGDLVGRPTVELIRAVITTHLNADTMATGPLDATLQVRILEYVRRHLSEADLSVEQVAAAHYISVRHLYKVLAASGISLSEWIRTRRLEACRKDLTEAAGTMTVAAIARRHGFTDMSSFSRSFRTEYGMTPRAWRHLPRGDRGTRQPSVP